MLRHSDSCSRVAFARIRVCAASRVRERPRSATEFTLLVFARVQPRERDPAHTITAGRVIRVTADATYSGASYARFKGTHRG